jgi:hypothetical protein
MTMIGQQDLLNALVDMVCTWPAGEGELNGFLHLLDDDWEQALANVRVDRL